MEAQWSTVLAGLLALFMVPSCDSTTPVVDDPTTEITVLVTYTPQVRAAVGDVERFVADAFAATNAAYDSSRIDVRLTLAHLAEVAYTSEERLRNLERLLRPDDGTLDDIHTLRDQHAADVVALVVDDRSATINAAVMAEPHTAFVIVHWDGLGAGGYALAHEVGHLQGARHTPDRDPNPEPFPYGHAFRNDTIKTILSTGTQRVVPRFSGPDQTFAGVVLGDAAQRDVARVLRETAVYISNFRGPQTPTDFVPPSTWPVLDVSD